MKSASRCCAARLVRGAVAIAVVLVVGTMASCRKQPSNMILIVVDTLRADHLPVYGYSRATSPSLDELAADATTFDACYSQSSATRPSVATLFSSRFVTGHGVATQGGDVLPADIPVLAEALHDVGYTCRGFITNPQIHPDLGFARGFDEYQTFFSSDINPRAIRPSDLLVKARAERVMAVVKASLQQGITEPFFLYIHLLDPHGPYKPLASDLARFADPQYHGPVTGSVDDFARIQLAGRRDGPDLQHFIDTYDAAVLGTDRALGSFFRWFRTTPWKRRTHLVVTADHGEEFMEHGGTGHGLKLYRETTSVPLIWTGPGVERGRHVDTLCGLVDIFPTIADIAGVDVSQDGLRGRSLRAELAGDEAGGAHRVLFLEGPAVGSVEGPEGRVPRVTRGLRTARYQAIVHGCVFRKLGWEQMELYDLDQDPAEQHPLLTSGGDDALPGWAAPVRSLYDRTAAKILGTRALGTRQVIELSDQEVEQLRSLGYIN